jgi:ferredoxin-nitrite reductase
MIDIQPNFAAVKQGLIPITPQEKLKLEKDGLDVVHDIYRYAKTGFASIEPDDFDRMKWYGVYRQKPKDSGYFMMRIKVPGGQVNAAQAQKLSEIADRFGTAFQTSPRGKRSNTTGCGSKTSRRSSASCRASA